jgi:hypothetical protein
MKGILKFLGTFGKGFGTLAGAVLALVGVVSGGSNDVVACVEKLVSQPDSAAILFGVLIAVFGLGRKAGWIASK